MSNEYTEQISKSHQLGIVQASYLVGFGSALKALEIDDAYIAQLVLSKMQLEYQQEMLRMELQSSENISMKNMEKAIEAMKESGKWGT